MYYTRSPYAQFMARLAQYGRRDFSRDTGGVHKIWYSYHYLFIYLFISEEKVCTCPVNQITIVRPTSFTWTQISYTTNQQTLNSWAINLCSRWPHYAQPHLHSSLTRMPASNPLWSVGKFLLFIYLLFVSGSMFACVGLLHLTLCYIMNTYLYTCISGIS